MRDHHSYVLGTCVGKKNGKHLLQYFLWVLISLMYLNIRTVMQIYYTNRVTGLGMQSIFDWFLIREYWTLWLMISNTAWFDFTNTLNLISSAFAHPNLLIDNSLILWQFVIFYRI